MLWSCVHGVLSLQDWSSSGLSLDLYALPNPQHIGTGTRQRGASPRPGAVPTSPWPPPAPNINFLHPLILLARMQGVLPLTQRVLGGRICWGHWELAKLPTQKPTLTRLQTTPSTHGAASDPVYQRATLKYPHYVRSMQNWVRGRSW